MQIDFWITNLDFWCTWKHSVYPPRSSLQVKSRYNQVVGLQRNLKQKRGNGGDLCLLMKKIVSDQYTSRAEKMSILVEQQLQDQWKLFSVQILIWIWAEYTWSRYWEQFAHHQFDKSHTFNSKMKEENLWPEWPRANFEKEHEERRNLQKTDWK